MLQQSRNLPAPIRISCIRYNILTLCFLKACHHPFPTVPNSLHPWLCSIADIVPSCCSPFPYLCSQSAHLQLLHLQLFPELFLCGSRQEEAQQPRTITGFSSPGVNRSSWPNSPSTIFLPTEPVGLLGQLSPLSSFSFLASLQSWVDAFSQHFPCPVSLNLFFFTQLSPTPEAFFSPHAYGMV